MTLAKKVNKSCTGRTKKTKISLKKRKTICKKQTYTKKITDNYHISSSEENLGNDIFPIAQETNNFQEKIIFHGIKTHNLKNIDIEIPKNKLITITGVSGSGKSSLAFHTIYKEGQFRYIESLSSYLRQFFNLGTRPDIESSFGLSPSIAIEQNKSVANNRSTMGTLTEIDDYLRLLFAKIGKPYSYVTGAPMVAQNIDTILDDLYTHYQNQKIFLLKESKKISDSKELESFVKNNRKKVEEGKGFTRYLIMSESTQNKNQKSISSSDKFSKEADVFSSQNLSSFSYLPPIEFFYLETPNIPDHYFPIKLFGIYDRITLEQTKKTRLKEDIIKILAQEKKFGVWCEVNQEYTKNQNKKGLKQDSDFLFIKRYTDKNYCPVSNIEYPDFTPQHFSFNRAEGACPHCHGIGEILQVDLDKVIDPQSSYMRAVLPRRDSRFGQAILFHLAQKYGIDQNRKWSELPTWFCQTVIEGDNELIRINTGNKFVSVRYKGIQEVLKDQYNQGVLTVDFQAMLEMKKCPVCNGAKLRKESLHVFLCIPKRDLLSFSSQIQEIFGFSLHSQDFFLSKAKENKTLSKKKNTKTDQKNKTIQYREKNLFSTCFHEAIVDDYDDGMIKINIAEMQAMNIRQIRFLLELYRKTTGKNKILVDRIIRPLLDRVQTIEDLGLGYLSPNRPISTLSGGELQRLRLAKQLGNKLTGIIYVLDEPTIGLSPKEITKVIEAIKKLQKMGNTIIVVEHNEEFILASDWIIEIGPGAGDFGGRVVFNGPIQDFLNSDTLTSQYVTHRKKVDVFFDHRPQNKWISIKKAHKYNLKHIDVSIQLGSFTIITGHSGAGKTTLMYDTLFRFLEEKHKFIQSYIRLQLLKQGYSWQEIINMPVIQKDHYETRQNQALQLFYEKEIAVETIRGYEDIDQVLYVDQTSIGKTPRSCPATFIGVFDAIRILYAGTNEAKYLGFTGGHFSFNSSKGACPECEGYGYKKVELQFLPDTYVPCELCNGRRYKPEILDILRRGKTITQVLDMYIADAYTFFSDMPHIARDLQLMVDIGLGYLRMGQPAHTLSGGESQRLKLVKHLLKEYKGHTLYFLDEPTVGLHPDDIGRLLNVLKQFLDRGDTILMIEHDPDLLRFADHVIELHDGEVLRSY